MTSNNRRRAPRIPLVQEGVIHANGKLIVRCTVRDVSSSGARLRLHEGAEIPEEFTLALSRNGKVYRRCTKVWCNSKDLGVSFPAE